MQHSYCDLLSSMIFNIGPRVKESVRLHVLLAGFILCAIAMNKTIIFTKTFTVFYNYFKKTIVIKLEARVVIYIYMFICTCILSSHIYLFCQNYCRHLPMGFSDFIIQFL